MKPTSPKQPPADDRGRVHPIWRHQRDYTPVIKVGAPAYLSGPFVIKRELIKGTDLATGDPITREVLTYTDGTTVVTDTNDNTGVETADPGLPQFVDKRASVEEHYTQLYDTDTATGEIVRFTRITAITTNPDGTTTYAPAADMAFDLTALYAPAGAVDAVPLVVPLGGEAIAVSGATPAALTPPAHAAYAEIYIEDANVRWTQDGSAPADNNGEQERAGTTISLLDTTALAGFRARPMDNLGDIASAGTMVVSVAYFNTKPERTPRGV